MSALSIFAFAAGYMANDYMKPSVESPSSDVDVGISTVPIEQHLNTLTKLDEARATIATLIIAQQRLQDQVATSDPADTASIAVYEAGIEDLNNKYDVLYAFAEANIEKFTPEIVHAGEMIEGLYINPNKVFSRDAGDGNLYVDSHDCIAVRGLTSKTVPVGYDTPSGQGFIKSKSMPNENTARLSMSTSWDGLALRTGSTNTYRIEGTSRPLNTNDRYRPWFMLELEENFDLNDYVGKIAAFTSTGWSRSSHDGDSNTWYDSTVFIAYRRNVLLVSPWIQYSNHYGPYKGQKGTVHLWHNLSGVDVKLPIVSAAVLNLPIAISSNGRSYPRWNSCSNISHDMFAATQANF